MQNTSHAVMAQRTEGKQSLDDFPTPLWATRALIEEVIGKDSVLGKTCLEPACGRGHMAVALDECVIQAVEDLGKLDNTIIIYISGDTLGEDSQVKPA